MTSILAPALPSGAIIAAVAAASPFNRAAFDRGVNLLESLGYQVVWRPDIHERQDYLAGSDDRRLEELYWAAEHPQASAVWAVRGGYGSMRLLGRLDFARLTARPKLWIGFSDISALLIAISAKTGLIGFHGPQIISLPRASRPVQTRTLGRLSDPNAPALLLENPEGNWRGGTAEGPLLPVNLSMLTALCGTGYLPDLSGWVLAIEDVNEPPYRIDRMLTQLELNGILNEISGMVCGQFTFAGNEQRELQQAQVKKRLTELADAHGYPLLGDAAFGHIDDNETLPVGARVRLDAAAGTLTLLKPVVA